LKAKVEHFLPTTTAAPTTPLAVTKTKKKEHASSLDYGKKRTALHLAAQWNHAEVLEVVPAGKSDQTTSNRRGFALIVHCLGWCH